MSSVTKRGTLLNLARKNATLYSCLPKNFHQTYDKEIGDLYQIYISILFMIIVNIYTQLIANHSVWVYHILNSKGYMYKN